MKRRGTNARGRSPSRSLFPYYYKGGELHCLKYGSFHRDEEALFARIEEEERFLLASRRRINTWVDLYETRLTPRVIDRIVSNIVNLHSQFDRLAIVGDLGFVARWRLNGGLRAGHVFDHTRVEYFRDPEVAKTWIVTGRIESDQPFAGS